jgi:hypothetical protein
MSNETNHQTLVPEMKITNRDSITTTSTQVQV